MQCANNCVGKKPQRFIQVHPYIFPENRSWMSVKKSIWFPVGSTISIIGFKKINWSFALTSLEGLLFHLLLHGDSLKDAERAFITRPCVWILSFKMLMVSDSSTSSVMVLPVNVLTNIWTMDERFGSSSKKKSVWQKRGMIQQSMKGSKATCFSGDSDLRSKTVNLGNLWSFFFEHVPKILDWFIVKQRAASENSAQYTILGEWFKNWVRWTI